MRSNLAVVVPVAVPFLVSIIPPVPVATPVVGMFKPATISVPVTYEKHLSIMMRWHPASPWVRWKSPITFMPRVTLFHHIPITVYPHVLGAGPSRQNANHTWSRWGANSDTNGELSPKDRSAGQ